MTVATSLLLLIAVQAAQAPSQQLAPELAPVARLVGHCWRATFPGATDQTDTHCYTAMFDGRMIRDRHIVAGAGSPYWGETIYHWDAEARRIRYEYYASDGGYSAGTAEPAADGGLSFPDQAYLSPAGQRLTLRYRLEWASADAYTGTSEMRRGEVWSQAWSMRFARIGPAPE